MKAHWSEPSMLGAGLRMLEEDTRIRVYDEQGRELRITVMTLLISDNELHLKVKV